MNTIEDQDYSIIAIPFHDWKKVQSEGARTRDAHIIENLANHESIGKILIVNRPTSLLEVIVKRKSWRTKGTLIDSGKNFQLVQVSNRLFVFDYFEYSVLSAAYFRFKWIIAKFEDPHYLLCLEKCIAELGIKQYSCLSFNVMAAGIFKNLKFKTGLFDAFDNFLRFPKYQSIREDLRELYIAYGKYSSHWSSNSEKNKLEFQEQFCVKNINVITNGVDVDRFSSKHEVPVKLKDIGKPIVGIGAKVTHLVDYDLINHLTEKFTNVSFVLIGQILDKHVFRKIIKRSNFFYLGDIPYNQYPGYVSSFDVCLIPYIPYERQHGGDAMKFYEYLAANKPIVSIEMPNISDAISGVYTAKSMDEFTKALNKGLRNSVISRNIPDEYTWKFKSKLYYEMLFGK
jgi:teichuronic acid biosynthesis glycosyltransferase TuaH